MITSLILAVASHPGLAATVYFFSIIFPLVVIAAALGYLLLRPLPNHSVYASLDRVYRRTSDIGIAFVASGVSWLLSFFLKNIFHVARPFVANAAFHPLFTKSDYSFPSQHAAAFAALAYVLFRIDRRVGAAAAFAALVIGAARILAGVHTPLDIIGGYILGAAVAFFVESLVGRPG